MDKQLRTNATRRFASELSADAVAEIHQIVAELWSGNAPPIDDIISDIGSARSSSLSLESEGNPKTMRDGLENLKAALLRFREAEQALDIYERHLLSGSIDEDCPDEILQKYDNVGEYAGMCGSTFHEIRELMKPLDSAIENALSKVSVTRGAQPNANARWLAFEIRESLENYDIKLTTYDSGIYFRILNVAFRDTFPELGEEAYRRHGAWALNEGDLYYE